MSEHQACQSDYLVGDLQAWFWSLLTSKELPLRAQVISFVPSQTSPPLSVECRSVLGSSSTLYDNKPLHQEQSDLRVRPNEILQGQVELLSVDCRATLSIAGLWLPCPCANSTPAWALQSCGDKKNCPAPATLDQAYVWSQLCLTWLFKANRVISNQTGVRTQHTTNWTVTGHTSRLWNWSHALQCQFWRKPPKTLNNKFSELQHEAEQCDQGTANISENTVLNGDTQNSQKIVRKGMGTSRDGGPEKTGDGERSLPRVKANKTKTQMKVDVCDQPESRNTKTVIGEKKNRKRRGPNFFVETKQTESVNAIAKCDGGAQIVITMDCGPSDSAMPRCMSQQVPVQQPVGSGKGCSVCSWYSRQLQLQEKDASKDEVHRVAPRTTW